MFKKSLYGVLLLATLVLMVTRAYADDTEIFFARANAANIQNKPIANVMILLDTSGSMRYCKDDLGFSGNQPTWCSDAKHRRIQELSDAFSSMIDNIPDGVRVGVSRFRGGRTDGAYVMVPVVKMNANNKQVLKNKVASLNSDGDSNGDPTGGTPSSESLYEMGRYMMGESPSYGNYGTQYGADNTTSACLASTQKQVCYTDWKDISGSCDTSQSTCRCDGRFYQYYNYCYGSFQTRTQSDSGSTCETKTTCTDSAPIVDSSGNYVSPMNDNNQCETDHVIFMTDGAPTPGELAPGCSKSSRHGGASIADSYACQQQIASYLNSDTNAKSHRVTTSYIGLYMGKYQSDMTAVSAKGGGATYNADSAESLAAAFAQQLNLIDKESKSITSPGVSVNQANRLEYLDQMYYSVFKPQDSSVWEGNLKRYRLDGNTIRDVNGMDAINPDTGYFSNYAKSWWSSDVDGYDAALGGAREQLSGRSIFYNTSNGGALSELTQAVVDNSSFTASNFGIPSSGATAAYDTKDKVYTALQTQWADPLHSVPLVVNYAGGNNTDASAQTNYVFVSTNGGMLHAVDPKDGTEKFSFMPNQEVKKAYDFVRSPGLLTNNIRKPYGLDSTWISWRKPEKASDGTDTGNAKNVYIYGGMRRGGDSYFALNVSNIDSPEMLWQIDGGYSGGTATNGFGLLAQTWSVPTLAQVKINDVDTPVLVFGGGYDAADNDTAGTRKTEDGYGRAIYMVNAKTGALIWSASKAASNTPGAHTQVSNMNWSVPGSIAVVDLNFDGYADYLYYADTGGQIFRVNLNNVNTGQDSLVDGVTRIADLGGSATADQRRFYSAPTIGYYKDSAGSESLYVTIGSGYRAHPLDENTDERVYSIRDKGFRDVGGKNYPITTSDLTQVGSTRQDSAPTNGWYYQFTRPGEKVLSSTVIQDGYVEFTTYVPTVQDQEKDPCTVRYGAAYFYAVNMRTGNVPSQEIASDNNGDGNTKAPITDLTWNGEKLKQSTIPPSPTTLYLNDGKTKATVVGTEVIQGDNIGSEKLRRNRWYMMGKDAANQFITPTGN